MDDSNNKRLSADEFIHGCRECKISKMSEKDLLTVFKHFDKDGNGELDYEEFLKAIRPQMNKAREDLVKKAFDKISIISPESKEEKQGTKGKKDMAEEEKEEVISLDDLTKLYNVQNHPKFQNGEMTKNEVLLEFLKCFEAADNVDGIVTMDEFMDYYAGVSASIDNDAYFNLMMFNSWQVKPN